MATLSLREEQELLTDLRVGDRVRLKVHASGQRAGDLGTVKDGFANLLCVAFDNDSEKLCTISFTVDGQQVYAVEVCERL